MAIACLFTGLCFQNPQLRETIQQSLGSLEEEKRLELLDSIKIAQDLIVSYIDSTVADRLDPILLSNQDQMTINESTDG